ncbi:MAG: MBOAT family protein [Clostridiaceae bacterium]|nr:MBOAT family protein [Clostridiaceae bacterium]
MVFSSLVFLCAFLPCVLGLYVICPGRFRNLLLLLASLFFYAWGEPRYILIMLFSTVFDYCNGRMIEYYDKQGRQKQKKRVLILSIAGNLAILCFFKYTDLLILSWNQLTASNLKLLGLALPIGISFYTFQTMSYTIDVYRGLVKPQHNILSFGMYVCMFPQLIAGPIVQYQTIEDQIDNRFVTDITWTEGMQRFLIGLGKKVLLANQIGELWSEISGGDLGSLSTAGAWLGAAAYTFQIYFDFSGYSDMAIGLGKLFGFRFPENFLYPYESKSISEFWCRWHISLGSWFRQYVYYPLGGNRKGIQIQIINLFIVWFLTGLWHGASWNFVLWGMYYFVLLVLEKIFLRKEMQRWPGFVCHIYTKFFVIVGWVIFALEDFGQMKSYLNAMFGVGHEFVNSDAIYLFKTYGILLIILILASTRIPKKGIRKLEEYIAKAEPEFAAKKGQKAKFIGYSLYTLLLLILSIGLLINGSYNPFLYFRF